MNVCFARKILFCILLPIAAVSLRAAGETCVWRGVERVVAVGDIHGDYERFVRILYDAGVIDRRGDWKGGRTHLVQLGDVPDRGPHPRRIMDLLAKLERQALQSGGKVHALVGNHEVMNIRGNLLYTTAEEFAEFRSPDSRRIRDHFFAQAVEEMRKKAESSGGAFTADDDFRRKWEDEHPLGYFEQRYAYGPNGAYSRWIRGHNTVIRIDDTLFVHAGISPKYADMAPEAINEAVRKDLGESSPQSGVAEDREGPLWYRGLAEEDERELALHVEAVLARYGVRRIVVGHTPTGTAVLPRFGCRVILADVGISKYFGGPPACLVIEKGVCYALHRGKKLKLPCGSGGELIPYLERAAALDPKPSAIEPLIRKLKLEAEPVIK